MKYSLVVYELVFFGLLFAPVLAGQQSADSTLPNIVVASSQADMTTTWQELGRGARLLDKSGGCDPNKDDSAWRRFKRPVSVGESVGGQVKTIRILRFASAGQRSPIDVVRKVWTGKFESSSCYIPWAEGVMWRLAADIEFEDGRQGVLITDSSHVGFKDHEGNSWFLRLLPAVQ